jgi:RNA polymerase sigma-70 factor (ECF subfamily)
MAGQAVLGERVLKPTMAMEAEALTVETLVASHSLMVFRIAYSILRSHHDAEDAAQECFLRVLKHQDRLGEIENMKTWLARVAWTTALDKRRARRAMVSLDDEDAGDAMRSLASAGAAPDDQAAGKQMQKMLERLIAGLPEELRLPLELSTVQELNSAEIAEVMKIPEGSVRTRLFRARKQLKEKLTTLLEVRRNG